MGNGDSLDGMTGKRLPNGIGVNFDDDAPGTAIRIGYKGALIAIRCATRTPVSRADREGICAFLAERGDAYFHDDGMTVSAASPSTVVTDLIKAGFTL